MDISYIVFNTIIYGMLATTLASFMAYGKFLNLTVAAYFILWWYVVHHAIYRWIDRGFLLIWAICIVSFFLINWLLLRFFPNEKQRDLAAIIITLASAYTLDNVMAYIYGPGSINIQWIDVSLWYLLLILWLLIIIFYYVFSKSTIWIILKAINEKTMVVQSLWLRTNRLLYCVFAIFLVLLIWSATLFLTKSAIKPSDGIFFLLKAIGIMIMVGISKKEYMFIGALLYVILEYLFFIQRKVPIIYKETLILFIILWVLILKPEWLFSLSKRTV